MAVKLLRTGWWWRRWRALVTFRLHDRRELKRQGFRYNWVTGGWQPPARGRPR